MKGVRVSSRYAKSLLLLAIEQNMLEEAYRDMKSIAKVCKENRDFLVFLRSPIVKADKKVKVIQKVFDGQLGKLVSGFIDIITNHRRENALGEIAASFVLQYKEYNKITTAELVSAVKLDDAQRNAVIEKIKKSFTATIDIKETIDPSIIGGMIVRVGDKQFDASITRKLKEMRKDFSTNAYIPQI